MTLEQVLKKLTEKSVMPAGPDLRQDDRSVPIIYCENPKLAAAYLSEAFYDYPSQKLKIAAVTGTNGKTSVTFILQHILQSAGHKAAVMGTLGYGDPQNLMDWSYTTPEAPLLSQALNSLTQQGYTHVCQEISSHALASYRADGLQFEIAGFTNLSQDHLDFHSTMEEYAAAKMRLFKELLPEGKMAVLPGHSRQSGNPCNTNELDSSAMSVNSRNDSEPSFRLGQASIQNDNSLDSLHGNDRKKYENGNNNNYDPDFRQDDSVSANNLQTNEHGYLHFNLHLNNQTFSVQSNLMAQFQVENALCAAGMALALGIEPEMIAQALTNCALPPGRFKKVDFDGKSPTVIVDYAHTPDALLRTLQQASALCAGRLFVVFGCGGNRDALKRPLMGKIAVENADYVIVTDDNPRWEKPEKIVEDILGGVILAEARIVANTNNHDDSGLRQNDNSYSLTIPRNPNLRVIHNRTDAIEHAIQQAKLEDWIVIAGKGHENYQQIKDEKISQSDYAIALSVLETAYPASKNLEKDVIASDCKERGNPQSFCHSRENGNPEKLIQWIASPTVRNTELDPDLRQDDDIVMNSNNPHDASLRWHDNVPFTGISIDSRTVKPGFLFIACPSETTGTDMIAKNIEQAIQNGARAIIRGFPK